jgi:RNA polymerase sigma-70 factor (ECF subfamily)
MNALFERYQSLVLRAASKAVGPTLRGREEPEDLAQTAFREAIHDLGTFVGTSGDSFRAWLRRIVENKARERARYWRAAKRDAGPGGRDEPGRTTTAARVPAGDRSVTGSVASKEERRLVRRAVESLPDRWRRVVEYAHYDGLSHAEIARRMGLPSEDAARMLLRRAESALASKLPDGLRPGR